MLELRNVTKTVAGADHIRDVSLTLQHGSLNVLLGPTLSGKTSLMRLMAGLDKPTSGSIWFDGVDVTGVPVQKRKIAMVYQQFINYPAMTVYENIASPLRVAGADKARIDQEVKRAAGLLKLTPYLDRTPLNLSGGQQQRTALARAIVKNASLCCSTSRSPISTTSCARSCAPNCRRSSPKPARSSSMPRPNRMRRCCWAAMSRRCRKAASPSSVRRSRCSASRST
jgi:ABC-type methionine transport system ATPase subunit